MNLKKNYAAAVFTVAALTLTSTPALAAKVAATTANVAVKLDTAAQAKADSAIKARIAALTSLQSRINDMAKVTASQKASLGLTIQTALGEMQTLQAKIDADTDNATLKADVQSITRSYRIYVLVLPQGRIVAEGDRVLTIASLFTSLSAQLQVRITAAQAAGQDTAALSASLSDMNAKSADASTQAQAAITEVAGLQPDNGDATVFQSNEAALKDARTKLAAAVADLKAARQDAGTIVKALEATKLKAKTNTPAPAATGTK